MGQWRRARRGGGLGRAQTLEYERTASILLTIARVGLVENRRKWRSWQHAQGVNGEFDLNALSPHERLALLSSIEKGKRTRVLHHGAKPIVADIMMHAVMAEEIGRLLPRAIVGGEEADQDEFRKRVDAARGGEMAVVVDAIDGTRSYRVHGTAWCIAMQALVFDGRSWIHHNAVLVSDAGEYIHADAKWRISRGNVFEPYLEVEEVTTYGPDPDELVEVRVIAAKPFDRRLYQPLLVRSPGWGIDTTGGNLVVFSFLRELCATVLVKPCKRWDSLSVPISSAMDLMVCDLEGQEHQHRDVLNFWNALDRDGAEVRPLVIVRPAYYDRVMSHLSEIKLRDWVEQQQKGA